MSSILLTVIVNWFHFLTNLNKMTNLCNIQIKYYSYCIGCDLGFIGIFGNFFGKRIQSIDRQDPALHAH